VAVPQSVASALHLRVGMRIPWRDRAGGRDSAVVVSGIWRPRDRDDAYWLLAPELTAGSSTTFGPFVVAGDDFDRTYAGTSASARWVAEPSLTTTGLDAVATLRRDLGPAVQRLPAATGLGDSAVVTTGLDALADRIARADATGRSSLAIPLALVVILGLCVLVRVAALLTEDRSQQTALLRARGASRPQLARLAAGEAALTVTSAAVLAPLVALPVLRDPGPALWLVAVIVAAGCLVAMLAPAAFAHGGRPGRPRRWAPAQRAGIDLLLVALAVLAWTQVRQYSGGGSTLLLDPTLPAAPVLAVLAGSVLALRVLPQLAAYAQRQAGHPRRFAATLGAWQAGRRPHTAQMLVLAFAVASSTLAWSLLATVDRSHADQAAQQVGADLRLTDATGPAARAAQLAAVPGVRSVTAGWHDDIRIGSTDQPATVLARTGIATSPPRSGVALPAGAQQLSGTATSEVRGVAVTALVTDAAGLIHPLPLRTGRFAVRLPTGTLRLTGFTADAAFGAYGRLDLAISELRTGATPLDAGATGWSVVGSRAAPDIGTGTVRGATDIDFGKPARLAIVAEAPGPPVPALVTPRILTLLDAKAGDTLPLSLPDADLTVRIAGVRDTLPGAGAAAIMVDLPSAVDQALAGSGVVRPYSQWFITTDPARDAEVAEAMGRLPGIGVLVLAAVQRSADQEPYWRGVRTGLLTAVVAVIVLALVGYLVDLWTGLRRRAGEYRVLRTLGVPRSAVVRSIVLENVLVGGAGALAGVLAGLLASAATVPLVIRTPEATRPVPAPTLILPCGPIAATALGLPLVILAASWILARGRRS
jgi:hypothetical protein